MLRRTLMVGLAGAVLAGCAQRMTRQERAVEEQLVRDRATAWVRVLNNRDRDSLALFYLQAPELTVAWPDGRRTNGWEEESQAQLEFFRPVTSMNVVTQDMRVEVFSAEVALTTFRYSADVIRGTARDLFVGQGTIVWVKTGPRSPWVIRAEQLSLTPPPPAEPPAPARRRR